MTGEENDARRPAVPSSQRVWMVLFFIAVYGVLAVPVIKDGALSATVFAITAALGIVLAVLSAIDLTTFRLPDLITLPLTAAGLALAWYFEWDSPLMRLAAAASGFLALYAVAFVYAWLRGREGLGMGDAKLLAAAGAWLGFDALPTLMLWATGTALMAVLIAVLMGRRVGGATHVPFGPFLALGFWLVWLYGTLS